MILRKEIQSNAGLWQVAPDTADKDYVLGHFLNSFYNDESNRNLFVFKGGTCLRKCYFPDFRFSEDLDFTMPDKSLAVDSLFFQRIVTHCEDNTGLRFWVKHIEHKQFKDEEKGYKCVVSFWGANHSQNETPPPKERWTSKIEIDISFDEEILYPLEYKNINHPYTDKDKISCIKIPVYSLTEMLIEKIRAFFQRSYKAPRDFFDVWYLLNNVTFDNRDVIYEMLQKKCALKNKAIDTSLFKDQQVYKTVSVAWNRSIAHHLPQNKLPDINEVWSYLDNNLFEKFLKI